jgi:hypothetical protein
VILYTCGQKKSLASLGRLVPWTWGERRHGREKIRALTGQINLPVLVLDEGQTVIGSGKIVEWAKAHPSYQPEVGGG